MGEKNLLELTLGAATKDGATVDAGSRPLAGLPDGMKVQRRPLHADDRGELTEIFSRRHGFDDAPFDDVYMVTIRPGVAKGWALHKQHDDRYYLVSGEMMVVLYDVRPDSSTCGRLFTVTLTERDRKLINIPAFVWHADVCLGTREAVLLNMPTRSFDPADPDKYRLPLDTPLIPYDFGGRTGY